MKGRWRLIIGAVAAAAMITAMAGCENEERSSTFPLDENGYMTRDVIFINGEKYDLNPEEKDGVKIDKVEAAGEDGEITIEMTQWIPTHLWSIEPKENVRLKKYELTEIEQENDSDGVSPYVQSFTFDAAPGETVMFKWHNVNEQGKAFSDVKEDRLLYVTVKEE